MPIIDLEKGRRLLGESAQRLKVGLAVKALAPYANYVQQINAADIQVMIQKGGDLRDYVPPGIISQGFAQFLAGLSVDSVIEVLQHYHQRLAAVLATPKGRAWLERQRGILF